MGRMLISYINKQMGWLLALLVVIAVSLVFLWAEAVPKEDICYLGLTECFVALVFGGADFALYVQKVKRVERLAASVRISPDVLEPAAECLEAAYQQLVREVAAAKRENETALQERFLNLKAYDTLWVHQIKTPIAAMRLLLQERSDEIDVSAEQDEMFRIEQYVEMLLHYMQLEAEPSDFVFQRVRLDTVVREAIHKYARLFIRKKLSVEYTPVSIEVLSDEKWLLFAVEQILSNAVKYTEHGKISIYCEQTEDGLPVLVIADTGIGIRAEDLPRVCDRGYTGYNGHEDKHSTGIGLYFTRSVLNRLACRLVLESEPDAGTKVKIVFQSYNNVSLGGKM